MPVTGGLWIAAVLPMAVLLVLMAVCRWGAIKAAPLGMALAAVMGAVVFRADGQLLVAQLNASLACFLPCCFALAAALLLGRTKRYRTPWSVPDSKIMRRKEPEAGEEAVMSLHQAFFPYYVMTAIALCVLLIPPLKSFLSQWQISFSFPETVTGYGYVNAAVAAYSPITPLTHAGLFLLIAAAAGFVYYRRKGFLKRARLGIWRRTWRKAVPSGAAITCFIVLSRLMSGTGQTDVLAKGIAGVLGGTYVLLVPMVGMLGSFITGSNMSSNVLFASFQMTTAALLGVSQAAFLGAQTAGGAIGSILCPGNIVLGTTTAGVLGQEGLVLRKLLSIAVAAAAVLGVLLCIALYIL